MLNTVEPYRVQEPAPASARSSIASPTDLNTVWWPETVAPRTRRFAEVGIDPLTRPRSERHHQIPRFSEGGAPFLDDDAGRAHGGIVQFPCVGGVGAHRVDVAALGHSDGLIPVA